MNRAHRRAHRNFRERLRSQMEQERNGAPIPPDIAARMTKPKDTDPLFQVGVTERDTRSVVFMGPMMSRDACGMMAEAVNKQILTGQRRDWMKAEVYPMTPVSHGVN